MSEDLYVVKFNRAESSVEVAGPDKEWVKEQLAHLLSRLDSTPAQASRRNRATSKATPAAAAAGAAQEHRTSRSRSRSRGRDGIGTNDELAVKLTEEVTDRLAAYMAERPAVTTAQEQAPVLAAFLAEELELEDVNAADLATVYKVMGWKIPGVQKALDNGTDRRQYFTRARGRFRLTRHGLNYARIDSKAEDNSHS